MQYIKHWCLSLWICIGCGCVLQAQNLDDTVLDTEVFEAFENNDILEILYQFEQKYPVYFFFKEEWIPRNKREIDFLGMPLGTALQNLFEGTDLGFVVVENDLVVIARRQDLLVMDAFSYTDFIAAINNLDNEKQAFLGQRFVVGDSLIRPIPATASISGVMYNVETEEVLAGGQISFPALETGAFANEKGEFEITIPTGRHQFIVTAPGHEELEAQVVIYSDGFFEAELNFTSYQLEEVLLSAEATGQSRESAESGRVNLSMIDINRMPSLMGEVDIISTILLKPGVTTTSEASSGFNIRGGNVDQNLILYGGNQVFNSGHLLGFFSVFNADVIESVSLYKGHMPAQYGGRVSSVLDVEIADGSFRRFGGSGSLGLLSSKISVNGPIQKEKSSYNVAVRGAYPLILTRTFRNNPDIRDSDSYYGDFVLKFTHKFNDFNKVSFTGYGSTDHFGFANNFEYDWTNLLGNLEWQSIFSDKLSTRLRLSSGRYQSILSSENFPDTLRNETGISNYQFQFNATYFPNKQHNINIGVTSTFYDLLPDIQDRTFGNGDQIHNEVQKGQGIESAIYINDEFDLNNLVRFSAGVRLSMFNNIGPYTLFDYQEGSDRTEVNIVGSREVPSGEMVKTFFNVEPRISTRIFLDNLTSLKASYNRTSQYIHLLSNTMAIAPIDIWQVSDTYFPAQVADNFSLGVFRDFKDKTWQTSLELFYRDFDGQVVSKNFAGFLNNSHIETEVLNAIGRAYGAEVSLGLKAKKVKVDGAFTYMRSLRQTLDNSGEEGINNNEWFPADFDSPVNISLTTIWTPNLWQSLSFNFVYRTGRPISLPLGVFNSYPTWNIPAFSERNNGRIPDYHRLDISYSFEPGVIRRRRTKTKVVISIYNVYARKNPFSVYFRNETSKFQAYQLSVLGTALPFIGYNFTF